MCQAIREAQASSGGQGAGGLNLTARCLQHEPSAYPFLHCKREKKTQTWKETTIPLSSLLNSRSQE